MKVKFRNSQSSAKDLIGGSPQGTLLGGLNYIIASFDCDASEEGCEEEDQFDYFDDLNMLELIILTEKLQEYDYLSHVPSDIGVEQMYIPPESMKMQSYVNAIQNWSNENMMKINRDKSNFILFNRSKDDFTTRLTISEDKIDRIPVIKLLGVWLQEDLGWQENTKQICKKAFSRITLLNKLKYVGIQTEDLLTIYKLFIRCIPEYCSSVFHSSLSEELSNKIERIQSTCLRVILSENYVSYSAALEMCGLDRLSTRREKRQLSFSLKCLKTEFTKDMFPLNENNKEPFHVNFARTEQYKNSTIPECQRKLNAHFSMKNCFNK